MSAPVTVDASGLLGLSSHAARVVMWLFVLSNVLYAVVTLDDVKHAAPVLLAVLIVNASAVLLVLEHPDPFPRLWTAGIIVAVAASTMLVAFQLPDVGPPGRASWHLGSNTWILFFLAMRRRPGAAWVGYALMAAGTIGWSVAVGRGPLDGVLLLDTHGAILFVATLFALNLRRTARRINEYDARSLGSAVEAAEAETSEEIRRRRVAELRASAVPLLKEIVREGPPPTAEARLVYRSSEALLRDGVRGRSLMTPAIAQAAMAARGRGVDVTFLDDRGRGLGSREAMTRMSDRVIEHLDESDSGAVTVRLAPLGRPIAVSIVSANAEDSHRIELDDDGRRRD